MQATSYGFLLGGLHVQKHEASRGFHIEGEPFSLKRWKVASASFGGAWT